MSVKKLRKQKVQTQEELNMKKREQKEMQKELVAPKRKRTHRRTDKQGEPLYAEISDEEEFDDYEECRDN